MSANTSGPTATVKRSVTVELDLRTAQRFLVAMEHLGSLYLPVYLTVQQAKRELEFAAAAAKERVAA